MLRAASISTPHTSTINSLLVSPGCDIAQYIAIKVSLRYTFEVVVAFLVGSKHEDSAQDDEMGCKQLVVWSMLRYRVATFLDLRTLPGTYGEPA